MSSASLWDPFRDPLTLRDAMGQLMEQAVMRPGVSRWGLGSTPYGALNVWATDRKYVCQMLLPGLDLDNIDLTVRQNTVTITAKVQAPEADPAEKAVSFLLHEFGAAEVSRSIALPKDVKADAVEATFEQGVLTVEVPIAEHAQPQKIAIRSTAGTRRVVEPKSAPRTLVEAGTSSHQAEP